MAIKINGTTVINDSRALSNIASVDATTVAAMGAAGVGGGLKLLQNYTTTSNATYFDIDFPTGYDWFKIIVSELRVTDSQYSGTFQARLKDSGGNLITSSSYMYHYMHLSDPSGSNSNRITLELRAFISGSTNGAQLVMDVYKPRDSNYTTRVEAASHCYGDFQTGYGPYAFGKNITHQLTYKTANTGIRIYDDGAYTAKAGTKIMVWGAVNA